MSKLFNKFTELKKIDNSKIYLLKSGIFYITLNEDAVKMSDIFGFKITKLNDTTTKCGFPESKLDFYTNILSKFNVNFEVVNSLDINNTSNISKLYLEIIDTIKSIQIGSISKEDSYNLLNDLHNKLSKN